VKQLKTGDLKNKNITYITPSKSPVSKKQKQKHLSREEKNKLKKRPKVENAIAKMKTYNRIHVRKDKWMVNYMGFVYLGFIKVTSLPNKPSATIKTPTKLNIKTTITSNICSLSANLNISKTVKETVKTVVIKTTVSDPENC